MASVLLIESEAPLVRLMAWLLIESGFDVECLPVTADSVACLPFTANPACAAHAPDVAVLNLNLEPPSELNCLCIGGIREKWPATPILAVVATGNKLTRSHIHGADRTLTLPFDTDTLLDAVTQLAAVHRALEPTNVV